MSDGLKFILMIVMDRFMRNVDDAWGFTLVKKKPQAFMLVCQ